MLEVKNLSKQFEEFKALSNVNFKINKGETLVIFGPSGCGKTTLLKCIKGLENTENENIISNTNNMGIVFQDFNIWDNMTVLQNTMLALKLVKKNNGKKALEKSLKILEEVGMLNKTHNYPHELSGGQKQRTAIARSLVMDPDILLLDEITSSLDPESINEVQKVIKKLSNNGKTMIISTHNLKFAKEIGEKFMFIDEGKIIEFGGKEIFENPINERTKEFLLEK